MRDQNKLSLSDNFVMLMSGLDTIFLEMSAHALLEAATKSCYRGKISENLAFLGYFSEARTEEYE